MIPRHLPQVAVERRRSLRCLRGRNDIPRSTARTVIKGVAVSRISRILSLASIAVLAAAPTVSAKSNKLESNLTAMWTTVLEIPTPDNPFAGGSGCIDLGGTLAPFAGGAEFSCTVKPGTKLFIVGYSAECSTWEDNGETEAELRQCAHDVVANAVGDVAPSVTVDGRALPLEAIETPLMDDIVLPADNIFLTDLGVQGGTPGLSVGFGWVALGQPSPAWDPHDHRRQHLHDDDRRPAGGVGPCGENVPVR